MVIIHEITDEFISLEYDYEYKYHQMLYGETVESLFSEEIEQREKFRIGYDDAIGCYFRGKREEYLSIDKDGVTFGKVAFDSIKYDLVYQGN